MISQSKDLRKTTGGMKQSHRKKRLYDKGGRAIQTKIGEKNVRQDRVMGGNIVLRTLRINLANVFDPKTKKYAKAAIKRVVNNPANRHYTRANVITKGAVIETELGNAKVTSRPGQEGAINAVLIS